MRTLKSKICAQFCEWTILECGSSGLKNEAVIAVLLEWSIAETTGELFGLTVSAVME